MIRFPWTARSRPLTPAECPKRARDLRFQRPECREKLKKLGRVAVVGGGFAGLMAARRLVQHGVKVTVFEARTEVGGRVSSNPNFSEGRITEEGAELIGSFHTKWLELAREFGLAMISRMDPELYEQECLDVRLTLEKGRFLSMKEFWALTKAMNDRVLMPLSDLAKKEIGDPSRPWLQSNLGKYDNMSVADAFETIYKVPRDGPLWRMLEFKLVNDEVAPLDQMNFLGLLCKVRAGQGERCVEDDDIRPSSSCVKDGYWEELEVFRCADGCQTLAKKIAEKIPEPAKVFRNVAITRIELSSNVGVKLWYKDTRDNKFVDLKAPPKPIPGFFSYVVLAIPPSVWSPPAMKITADGKDADPAKEKEIGQMRMNDAVKYFSDVKERFWIKERADRPDPRRDRGSAPYGGSFRIGQVWEGTDNQTRIGKQGIVLSVFAGPISPSRRAPTRKDFADELPHLYRGYNDNLIKRKGNPLFSDWPNVPFIKAGYWSPRPGDIWKVGEKLTKPYHDRLFFAGEHTQMDFFGYMEGALRSGERAAETLMLHACGLLENIAPKPLRPVLVARAAPTRESAALEREVGAPFKKRAFSDAGEGESPFLGRDLFAGEAAAEWEPRVAALAAESPFVNALEKTGNGFDWGEAEEEEAVDSLDGEEELEAPEVWEEPEEEEAAPPGVDLVVRESPFAAYELDRAGPVPEVGESEEFEEEDPAVEVEPSAELDLSEVECESPLEEPETEADFERLVEAQLGLTGDDDRTEVPDTTIEPYRWICSVTYEKEGQTLNGGTGLLISNRHVLTAAHVITEARLGEPNAPSLVIYPGRHYGDDERFGRYLAARADVPNFRLDFGLITLNRPVDPSLLWWGHPSTNTVWWSEAAIPLRDLRQRAFPITTAGYPGAKDAYRRRMFEARGQTVPGTFGATFRHTADTTQGQSGSPIWTEQGGRRILIGIVAAYDRLPNQIAVFAHDAIVQRQVQRWMAPDAPRPRPVKRRIALEVPYRWICRLEVSDNDLRRVVGYGTGLLISGRHVLTSARVIHDFSKDRRRYSVRVTPGYEFGKEAFGSTTASQARVSPKFSPETRDGSADYGVLTLSRSLGSATYPSIGNVALGSWGGPSHGLSTSVADWSGKVAHLAAFSRSSGGGGGYHRLRVSSGRFVGLQRGQILHNASSKLDAPGAPIWIEGGGRRVLVGIASSIFSKDSAVNWGCYLSQETLSHLMQWINEDYERRELDAGDYFSRDELESLLASPAEAESRTAETETHGEHDGGFHNAGLDGVHAAHRR